jgi:hypothetical protein
MRRLSFCLGLVVAAALAAAASDSHSVKLVGCLEHDTPASSALATSASQITAFALTEIDAAAFHSAASSAGIDASGPAAVRLQDDGDFTTLLDHVGRRVEVKGRFIEDSSTVRPAKGLAITAQGTVPWLPVLRVTSVNTVAKACH